MAKLSEIILEPDTRANQPAASAVAVGAIYCVTDEDNILERSNGTTWDPFSPSGAPAGVLLADGSVPMTGDLDAGGNQLTNIGAPAAADDAATKDYVDDAAAVAGGLVLLESRTAAGSAALTFGTRNAAGQSGALFQADFDEYMIDLIGLIPASNDVNARMRFSTDGGSSYDAAGNYSHTFTWQSTNNSTGAGGAGGATYADMGGNVANGATGGLYGTYRLFLPLSATTHKTLIGSSSFLHTTIGRMGWHRSLHYLITTALTNLQIDMVAASGGAAVNIASGTVRVYGVRK